MGKPFIVILNSNHPKLPETERLAETLTLEHKVPVIPINIETMNEKDMYNILKEALYEFPVLEVRINMPEWISILNPNNKIKKAYIDSIRESVIEIDKIKDIEKITKHFLENEYIEKCYLSDIDTSTGIITVNLTSPGQLYNQTSFLYYEEQILSCKVKGKNKKVIVDNRVTIKHDHSTTVDKSIKRVNKHRH